MRWSKGEGEVVSRLAVTARKFCTLIERRQRVSKRVLVMDCARLVAELQSQLTALLKVRTKGFPRREISARRGRRWRTLFENLGRKLGRDNKYYLVFDPYKPDEIIASPLSDDLADIYNDMKEGLELIVLEDERSLQQAAALWKFSFLSHTGHHCVSCLRALQELLERHHDW